MIYIAIGAGILAGILAWLAIYPVARTHVLMKADARMIGFRIEEPDLFDWGPKYEVEEMRWRWVIWREGHQEGDHPLMFANAPTEEQARKDAWGWVTKERLVHML